MGADTKKLKTRIRSVDSTMHITKAMELVASSKLKHAMTALDLNRPYTEAMAEVFTSLADCKSVFSQPRDEGKILVFTIAGDRGLAGGYNNDIFKMLREFSDGKDVTVFSIGKRMHDYAAKRGISEVGVFPSVEDVTLDGCAEAGKLAADGFTDGTYDAVYVIYTSYRSVMSREPRAEKLLPLTKADDTAVKNDILFEPSSEEVLAAAVPEYVAGRIYGAVCESFTSELSARRMAMDSATKNAGEMIDALSLKYNRARQGAITQEITEIIGGSETQ